MNLESEAGLGRSDGGRASPRAERRVSYALLFRKQKSIPIPISIQIVEMKEPKRITTKKTTKCGRRRVGD